MNKLWILVPVSFVFGSIAGFLMYELRQPGSQAEPDVALETSTPMEHLDDTEALDQARLLALEAKIAELQFRIEHIESGQAATQYEEPATEPVENTIALATASVIDGTTQAPIIEGLVRAGIDSWTAEDIARKQSESSLARLELRDQATREGYIGTRRYRQELRQLMESEFSIREEVGEDYFDRYLFHTGQNNRVTVESVMMGSAAEEVGLQSGDLLVRYEDRRLFNWNDLRSMTTQGDRNEMVELTIVRSGTPMTMTIPRGPIGVRLNSIRIDPEGDN